MRHLISLHDVETSYLAELIDLALTIKANPGEYANKLAGKMAYFLFQKTSTRTALSFAMGIKELGGEYFLQNYEDSNFAVGEIRDEIRYISSNLDLIMARMKENSDLLEMAEYSTVPVINGCCNKYHPCQALADLLTLREVFDSLQVKVLYVGVQNNVFNCLAASLPRLGGKLYAATPLINEAARNDALVDAAKATGNLELVDCDAQTVRDVVQEVDAVYTDTWVDMEFFADASYQAEKEARTKAMMPFQFNETLLADSKAIVMHDMPIHPGFEITRDVIEKHMDTILRQAQNRKHAQKAVMASLLSAD